MRGRVTNVWERARSPELHRYCDLVASASSKLAGLSPMPEAALEAAKEADTVLPGHAAPRALEGRALALLGKLDDAMVHLRDAAVRDPRALDDPATLFAWARALAKSGHIDEARTAYRALLPRVVALPRAERASAATEAGLVAMASGPSGLDDAVAALRDATRDAEDDTATVAALALALALDRRGHFDEARALLGDRALVAERDPRVALASPRAQDLLAVSPNERFALSALALETLDPPSARDAWRQYLAAAPSGPWAAHAGTHLAAPTDRRPKAPR